MLGLETRGPWTLNLLLELSSFPFNCSKFQALYAKLFRFVMSMQTLKLEVLYWEMFFPCSWTIRELCQGSPNFYQGHSSSHPPSLRIPPSHPHLPPDRRKTVELTSQTRVCLFTLPANDANYGKSAKSRIYLQLFLFVFQQPIGREHDKTGGCDIDWIQTLLSRKRTKFFNSYLCT